MMEKDINLSERILNNILGDITPRESVKVMGRTFSDAFPVLLGRRGAKSAQLQMVGTWSLMAVRRHMPRAKINGDTFKLKFLYAGGIESWDDALVNEWMEHDDVDRQYR